MASVSWAYPHDELIALRQRNASAEKAAEQGVAALIPFMLEAFINADHGFKRARKKLEETRPPTSSTQTKET